MLIKPLSSRTRATRRCRGEHLIFSYLILFYLVRGEQARKSTLGTSASRGVVRDARAERRDEVRTPCRAPCAWPVATGPRFGKEPQQGQVEAAQAHRASLLRVAAAVLLAIAILHTDHWLGVAGSVAGSVGLVLGSNMALSQACRR